MSVQYVEDRLMKIFSNDNHVKSIPLTDFMELASKVDDLIENQTTAEFNTTDEVLEVIGELFPNPKIEWNNGKRYFISSGEIGICMYMNERYSTLTRKKIFCPYNFRLYDSAFLLESEVDKDAKNYCAN